MHKPLTPIYQRRTREASAAAELKAILRKGAEGTLFTVREVYATELRGGKLSQEGGIEFEDIEHARHFADELTRWAGGIYLLTEPDEEEEETILDPLEVKADEAERRYEQSKGV